MLPNLPDKTMSPVVTIKPSGKVISVMEGKTLRLICEVAGSNKASVTWTSQSKRGVLSQNFELNLVKIKIEDTGVYECTATTRKGEGKAFVSVVVQSKLVFILFFLFYKKNLETKLTL